MSLPTRSLSQVLQRITAFFRTSFRGTPLGIKYFLGRAARAVALSVWLIHADVEDVDGDIVPSAASSDDALSTWAALLGLPNGQGGFGRLLPTTASGGVATLTGVKATVYPNAAQATAEDGITTVALSGGVTIPGSAPGFGSVGAAFVAVTTGTAGNLPVGSVLTWSNPPAGADPTFTLTSPLAGAIDLESNPATYARIVTRQQQPPQGGVASDYAEWALTQGGVARGYVYPKRSGTGSVDMVLVAGGSGQGRKATAATKTLVDAYILTKRPAAADATNTLLPYMPNGAGHLVRVRVTPSGSRYAFDWDDTSGGPFTVDTYTAGAPATLKLNTLAPASLKNAITTFIALAGLAPRLQVLSANGSAINLPVRATNFSDSGGKTTLTLENPLPVGPTGAPWAPPNTGDTVYAYGPVVATIAAGLLAFCDALGPSRLSGYGDPIAPWLDTLTISGLIRVAEDAVDTDGTKLIREVPVGLATIDGTAADVQASDNSPNGPELLYLSHVAVTA
jgi:hypothetical protein